jgi:hypothetical protein
VKLRDHPQINREGTANWPPLWRRSDRHDLTGEVGVLANADSDRTGTRCYLSINFDNERYTGTILFEDKKFCWYVAKTLKNRIGMPVKDIGDLELPHTL